MRYIKTKLDDFLKENLNTHLVEVKPNRFVYHTSNPIFRDKIRQEGFFEQELSSLIKYPVAFKCQIEIDCVEPKTTLVGEYVY